MVRTVQGEDLAKAIVARMREYTEDVGAAVRAEVDQAATDIKNAIESKSPVESGKYAKGWKVTKRDTQGVTSRIVHNRVYQLPHLLEHGHAKRGGGRVAGIPHIKPAADPRLDQMFRNIKEIVRKGG